jgi:hypothetical protein
MNKNEIDLSKYRSFACYILLLFGEFEGRGIKGCSCLNYMGSYLALNFGLFLFVNLLSKLGLFLHSFGTLNYHQTLPSRFPFSNSEFLLLYY